jgi:hypothetical protein
LRYSKFLFSFLISFVFLFFTSCDDGNIITTTFNFNDETDLSLCQDGNVNLLYFIDQDTNEAISFEFNRDDFDGTFLEDNDVTTFEFTVDINNTNRVTYRRLSASTNANDYFCQEVPPSSPVVLEEFVSTTGGTATFVITISEQDDGDGVPADLEMSEGDTDGDGIPDFLDIDDDNDNVLTSVEAVFEVDENDNPIPGQYVDTDNDGIPNYLDNDDDGDGVLTKNEDLNYCEDPENPVLNPGNDLNAEGPLYLDENATESVSINVVKPNDINRSFFTLVVFDNITFENQNNQESLTFTSFIMGRYDTSAGQDLPFNDTVTSIDEVGNICQ